MSFLAGRIAAAKEGSYFLQESKNAVGGLAQKLPASASPPGPPAQPSPDVLPEILRHSVPIKGTPPPSQTSLHACSRWTLPPGEAVGVSPDALNPLRSFVSLPQATFGPKRWQLPNESLSTRHQQPMNGGWIGTHLLWTLKS